MRHAALAAAGLLVGSLFFAGCTPIERIAPPVGPEVVGVGAKSGVAAESLQRGRDIYLTSCTHCHSPQRIDRYPTTAWNEEILPDMAKRSKLEASQKSDLRAYVLAAHEAMTSGALNAKPAGK